MRVIKKRRGRLQVEAALLLLLGLLQGRERRGHALRHRARVPFEDRNLRNARRVGYRGTSLIINRPPPQDYHRALVIVLLRGRGFL